MGPINALNTVEAELNQLRSLPTHLVRHVIREGLKTLVRQQRQECSRSARFAVLYEHRAQVVDVTKANLAELEARIEYIALVALVKALR